MACLVCMRACMHNMCVHACLVCAHVALSPGPSRWQGTLALDGGGACINQVVVVVVMCVCVCAGAGDGVCVYVLLLVVMVVCVMCV